MDLDVNWFIIVPVAIAAVALVVYLIIKNHKDEIEYEKSENAFVGDDDDDLESDDSK